MGKALVPAQAREAELERMMQAYGNLLAGLCTGLLRDRDLAQDVVQETFVRAWRRMDDLRCVQSEKAWLTRIALNLCRDQQRTRWFRSVIRDETLLDQIPAPETSDHSEVLEAVGRLPQRLREVIMLHYYENLDAPEMAQILGITPSAVYRRLRQARGKLQILLKGADDDD